MVSPFLLQNGRTVWEALRNLLSQLPLLGLTDANKNRALMNRRMERPRGESRDLSQHSRKLYRAVET